MEEYKAKAKELVSRLYTQGNPVDYDACLSTQQIYKDLICLLPAKAIDEFDVYDILSSLYTPFYTSHSEEVTLKGEDGEDKVEYKTKDGALYLWYLKRI